MRPEQLRPPIARHEAGEKIRASLPVTPVSAVLQRILLLPHGHLLL
jgi:hypothetical protein